MAAGVKRDAKYWAEVARQKKIARGQVEVSKPKESVPFKRLKHMFEFFNNNIFAQLTPRAKLIFSVTDKYSYKQWYKEAKRIAEEAVFTLHISMSYLAQSAANDQIYTWVTKDLLRQRFFDLPNDPPDDYVAFVADIDVELCQGDIKVTLLKQRERLSVWSVPIGLFLYGRRCHGYPNFNRKYVVRGEDPETRQHTATIAMLGYATLVGDRHTTDVVRDSTGGARGVANGHSGEHRQFVRESRVGFGPTSGSDVVRANSGLTRQIGILIPKGFKLNTAPPSSTDPDVAMDEIIE